MNKTMAPYRVLVVDDRPEMRDMMRSTVETLGSRVDVLAVPSGEEALLEIQLQHFDLLISDVLLAGINGIELMRKALIRRPDLKVILVTGVTDPQLRQAAEDAGADGFFLKPMQPDDLLHTIALCMGQEGAEPQANEDSDIQQSNGRISEQLLKIQRDTGAFTVVLTDVDGRVQAQAGDLQHAPIEPELFPLLMACLDAGSKIALFTGSKQSRDLMYFNGNNFDIYAAHVGDSHTLVMVVNPVFPGDNFGHTANMVHHAIQKLQGVLLNLEGLADPEDSVEPEDLDIHEDDLQAEASIMDALFKSAAGKIPGNQDVDAFWDSLAHDSTGSDLKNPDMLTFDQALQLGLTPGDDED